MKKLYIGLTFITFISPWFNFLARKNLEMTGVAPESAWITAFLLSFLSVCVAALAIDKIRR